MRPVQYEHTHIGAYLVGAFAVACCFADNAQGLIERNRLNRKWLLLYGVLCIFAYLYARPFIRVGLGSAKRGYINWSTVYIVWLCSAVFYHLPSLEQLGLDVRADLSILIVVFVSSLAALALLVGLHTAAVYLRLLPRRGQAPVPGADGSAARAAAATATASFYGSAGGGLWNLWVLLLLNSMIIAVACSTYHSFCGNGTLQVDARTPTLKVAVCAKWLHPILTAHYPRFASWMLYGEGSTGKLAASPQVGPPPPVSAFGGPQLLNGSATGEPSIGGGNGSSAGAGGFISVDFPLDGRGVQSVPAADVLSPLLTMWISLIALYVANTLAGQPGLPADNDGDALSGPGFGSARNSSSTIIGSGGGGSLTRRRRSAVAAAGGAGSVLTTRRMASLRRPPPGGGQERAQQAGVPVPVAAAAAAGGGGGAAAAAGGGGGGGARGGGAAAGGTTAAAAAGSGEGGRKARHRTLEVKRRINKVASADAAARGAATAVAVAKGSMTSLNRLAASTIRLRHAAVDYLNTSHPYLPALLGKVRRGMAALEPTHLAEELAQATGVPRQLARALTRGSSWSFLADEALAQLEAGAGGAAAAAAVGSATQPGGFAALAPGGAMPYAMPYAGATWGGNGRMASGFGGVPGGGAAAAAAAGAEDATSAAAAVAGAAGEEPDFLDMVPWYSGTSADLFKTLFDLMVSLKLFLGRFDMRTMQAATAASMADSFNDTPAEGDGFTYEHLDERPQIWLDFIADTGDGGNPTYAVASALAAPALTVEVAEGLQLPSDEGGSGTAPLVKPGSSLVLPRGDVLLLGGDLAYPNPSKDTYHQRLFRPFEDALPPPPHYHIGRLVVHKPDLPQAWGVHEAHLPYDLRGLSPRSSRRASSAALRRYPGPTAFAIPGNHDWIDGLETFTREIQHKGWLGGWLLPQEKSYFALRLPAGWWLFGFDLALVKDIDMQQYRYFANVVEQRMAPGDQVILVTHEPLWLLEWFWQRRCGSNLRQLVRGHLRGRARLHLAGDLHFYMRHSWTERRTQSPQPSEEPSPRQSHVTEDEVEDEEDDDDGEEDQEGSGMGEEAVKGKRAQQPQGQTQAQTQRQGQGQGRGQQRSLGVRQAAPHRRPPRPPQQPIAAAATMTDPMAVQLAAVAGPGGGGVDSAVGAGGGPEGGTAPADGGTAPADICGGNDECRPDVLGASSDERSEDGGRGFLDRGSGGAGNGFRYGIPPVGLGCAEDASGGSVAVVSGRGAEASGASGSRGGKLTSAGHLNRRLGPLQPPNLVVDGSSGDELYGNIGGGGFGGSVSASSSSRRPLRLCKGCRARLAWSRHPHDPEHLVVNGGGGAFLHPTHVFAGARFPAPYDPAAEATAGLYAAVALPCTCGIYSPGSALYGGAPGGRLGLYGSTTTSAWNMPPQQPRLQSDVAPLPLPYIFDPTPQPGGPLRARGGGGPAGGIAAYAAMGPDGEYVCGACYPSPQTSMQLGRKNLHVFRLRNTRFDVIGGVFYFLLVVSVLPRCSHLAEVLEADTPANAASLLVAAYLETLAAIVGRSYLSAVAVALMFLITLSLAIGGGVGAVPGSPSASGAAGRTAAGGGPAAANAAAAAPAPVVAPHPLFAARLGGFALQLVFAVAHTLTHVSLAIMLLLLLELGVETCIKYERLGTDGPHSLYRWYRAYEEEHFPDPMGVRAFLQRWTFGVYPGALQLAMGVFDVPELIAVTRTAMCAAGGSLEPISRLQALSYYAGMLSYYWLLATPAIGFVFGLYLYLSVCWCHVHYDEAFSSLREASCKSFCRLHIGHDGDLRLYTLALDEVPSRWQEDPRWRGPNGGGHPGIVAHEAHYPSRWKPAKPDASSSSSAAVVGPAAAPKPAAAAGLSGRAGGTAAGEKAPAAAAAGAGGRKSSSVGASGGDSGGRWRLVDYVVVPRKQLL